MGREFARMVVDFVKRVDLKPIILNSFIPGSQCPGYAMLSFVFNFICFLVVFVVFLFGCFFVCLFFLCFLFVFCFFHATLETWPLGKSWPLVGQDHKSAVIGFHLKDVYLVRRRKQALH